MEINYPDDPKLTYAVIRLSDILERQQEDPDPDYKHITEHKEVVFSFYQPLFKRENIKKISKASFLSFLLYKNNHHWTGLNRVGKYMTDDMDLLREALYILLDESRPVEERLNEIRPERHWGENSMVSHLGMPVLTAVLLVSHPEKYGVWNNTSDEGLKELKLWDKAWETSPAGDSYLQMNNMYIMLSSCLHIDLWTLDALWWVITKKQVK